jgi:hypothetical protein
LAVWIELDSASCTAQIVSSSARIGPVSYSAAST